MSDRDYEAYETYGIDIEPIAVSSPYDTIDGVENVDHIVCVCARNDYLPTNDWVGSSTYDEIMQGSSTEQLIDRLMKPPGHWGPFEHPDVTVAIHGISRVTMAQLTRHRHASFDVQSGRYTKPPLELINEIGRRETDVSALHDYVVLPKAAYVTGRERQWLWRYYRAFQTYFNEYHEFINAGLSEARAKEDARYLLPKGLRVNVVATMNLRAWMHIADMRAAADAQWEIRALTKGLIDEIETIAPVTMEKYRKYRLDNNIKHRLAP